MKILSMSSEAPVARAKLFIRVCRNCPCYRGAMEAPARTYARGVENDEPDSDEEDIVVEMFQQSNMAVAEPQITMAVINGISGFDSD